MTQPTALRGIIPAMVTPRNADTDDIDTGKLADFVDYLIASGVHGVFPASSTGEAPSLTQAQRRTLIETTVTAARGRVPVLAGVGAPSTSMSIAFARDAEDAGADYIVILPSHFVALTQDELYAYFATVSESVDIPTILYNYPARTSGQSIRPELAARLAQSHNIIGIKDSSGDLTNTLAYIDSCGDLFAVFTGSESLIYPCMAMGGAGSICAGANVYPKRLVALYNAASRADHETAAKLQKPFVKLRRWGSIGTFPAPVKAAMALLGHDAGLPFAPTQPLSGDTLDAIKRLVEEIGLDAD
jgi:4-hydroxy-tetrahydrodipicolinate synthase